MSALFFLFFLFSINEVSSDVSVSTENNIQTIRGRSSDEKWFYLDLNNSDDEKVNGILRVESAERYDNLKTRPGSTIIATLSGEGEEDFEIGPNSQITIRLKVRILEYAPGGSYYFPLFLEVNGSEEDLDTELAILEIEEYSKIELDIEDTTAKDINPGHRVDFPVTLINEGNMVEKVTFNLRDYPVDWIYPGSGEEGMYFSETPIEVPIYNPDKGEKGERTIDFVVYVPEDLEIEEYSKFKAEIQVYAESEGGEKTEDVKIRMNILNPEDSIEGDDLSTEGGWANKLPFPREYVFLFPVAVILGGVVIMFSNRKKEAIEVPGWAGDEDYDDDYDDENVVDGIEEEMTKPKIETKPTVKCPKCKVSIRVSNPTRPLAIKCPKCTTRFTLKGKEEAKPTTIKCPKCQSSMKVMSSKRPLTVSCFKCKAKIVLKAKGDKAPAKVTAKGSTISCPKCKAKLKIASEKRPLTIHCPKCSSKVVIKGKSTAKKMGPTTKPTTIKCPKCSVKLKVTTDKRPLTILCPKCKAKVVLKGKDSHIPSPKSKKDIAKPTTIKCPKCKSSLKIKSTKRPLTIHCPKCSAKVVLKGKEGAKPQKPISQKPAPQKSKSTKTTIKCPKCKTSLKVSNPKRPLTIHCPKCKAKVVLKGKEGAKPQKPTSQKTSPKTSGAKPKTVKCPKCTTSLKIKNPKRPLTISCPKCKAKLNLK